MSVHERYQTLHQKILEACSRSNRDPEEIEVVAVTKYVSINTAKEAIEAGISHLGENRIEGFQEKFHAIGNKVTWHFIGTLQSRKVKEVIEDVDFIHSLDRKSLAKEINKRASDQTNCFVQVNTSGEESKHGLAPDQVEPFIEMLENYPNIRVVGLMTMAPLTEDRELIRNCFKKLRLYRDRIRDKHLKYAPCTYLSMGMSNDFEIAIEEGATHIRVGSSLVGYEKD